MARVRSLILAHQREGTRLLEPVRQRYLLEARLLRQLARTDRVGPDHPPDHLPFERLRKSGHAPLPFCPRVYRSRRQLPWHRGSSGLSTTGGPTASPAPVVAASGSIDSSKPRARRQPPQEVALSTFLGTRAERWRSGS